MATQINYQLSIEFDDQHNCVVCGKAGTLVSGIGYFCEHCPPMSPKQRLSKYIDKPATKISDAWDEYAGLVHDRLLHCLRTDQLTGWDDPDWSLDDIKQALIKHIERGDSIDIAAYAMFLWNKTRETHG